MVFGCKTACGVIFQGVIETLVEEIFGDYYAQKRNHSYVIDYI